MKDYDNADRERADSLGNLLDLPVEVAAEFRDWVPDWLQQGPLSTEEMRFLKVVIGNPGQASSVYPKLAQMSVNKAVKTRKRLVELGYLRETSVRTKARGRASIIVEATKLAADLFGTEQGA